MTRDTAVQWLYNNLKSHFEHDGDLLEVVQFSFEQAKEMEKLDIMDAWKLGNLSTYLGKSTTAEKYYNNNFKH